MMAATNFDDSWDKENVRLRCHQIWLNDDNLADQRDAADGLVDAGGQMAPLRSSLGEAERRRAQWR